MSENHAVIRAAVLDGLRQIAPETDLETLSPSSDIRRSLEIDSFDFLRFLIGLHERLGVDIPEMDYGKLTTLDSLVEYLAKRRGI